MGQSFTIQPGVGLPSQRELEQWQAECDRIDEQVAALARRKRGFEALIGAARQLWEDFGVPLTAPEPARLDGGEPAPPASRTAASEAVSWANLRAEVLGRLPPRPAPRQRAGGKADDSPVNRPRLVDRASIVPPKGQLFGPAAPPPTLPIGRLQDMFVPPPAAAAPPSMSEAILAFLDRVSVGAPSAVIISELRRQPHFAEQVDANKAQVFNLLSRLVDDGEVLKGGGVYYRNRQRPPRIETAE